MRYILRADSSPAIGSGHVMRLSAIAEELIARGEKVIFVGQHTDIPWLASRINALGFSQILQSATGYVSNPGTDVLILDSYTLPLDDEFIQQNKWWRIVAIADELTPAYLVDLIIHPGITAKWETNLDIKCLSGPNYIPFRKSITKSATTLRSDMVLEILVVGGGTDPFNFVTAICMTLRNIQGEFNARVFSNNISLPELDSRFTVVPIGPELDVYATSAELVFTTASTTSLEFIAREIAVGIGCAVDNQAPYYEALVSAGVAIPIGTFYKGSWELDELRIEEMIYSKELRETLKQKSSGLFDLSGAIRIVDEILKL
jgi:spore coat polysaccharide biosynthesis predicted glycosyltransferase SpsG